MMSKAKTIVVSIVAIALALLLIAPLALAGAPTVTSVAASSVGDTQARLNGNVGALGTGTTQVQVGFLYGTSSVLAGATNVTVGTKTTTGAFSHVVTGLSSGVKYYFRAWARNYTGGSAHAGYATGSILHFTTGSTVASIQNSVSLLNAVLFVLVPIVVIVAVFGLIYGLLAGRNSVFSKMNMGYEKK